MALLEIETDYLIIGSGTTGLAFADTLIAETGDCTASAIDFRPIQPSSRATRSCCRSYACRNLPSAPP
jgi:hypothetical protein